MWLCVFGCVLQGPFRFEGTELMLGTNEGLAS